MTIKQQLIDEMKDAMRNKDKATLTTVRLVIDRVQKKEKELLREISEEEAVQVLQTFKKQIQEEADAFAKAGKLSREAVIIDSLAFIDKFLPQQMSEQEINSIVIRVIEGISGTPNKGAVMKEVMPLVKGKADNKLVNQIVTNLLQL
ncbi:GatB/YqeY domain-containing protein [Paenibacillus agilis]|uniref:GatB/YqeY domain-containing protein n=1 Tax=Paenibacillus agilis TaxID=3020863 RepID=A0A559IEC2_9BACL|nr:GatB/YqeY domain-containing protein [Paenibacillus agilis]TVX85996.1 hypothetical protein FPZ44_23905 [Paenibacillus agilis]